MRASEREREKRQRLQQPAKAGAHAGRVPVFQRGVGGRGRGSSSSSRSRCHGSSCGRRSRRGEDGGGAGCDGGGRCGGAAAGVGAPAPPPADAAASAVPRRAHAEVGQVGGGDPGAAQAHAHLAGVLRHGRGGGARLRHGRVLPSRPVGAAQLPRRDPLAVAVGGRARGRGDRPRRRWWRRRHAVRGVHPEEGHRGGVPRGRAPDRHDGAPAAPPRAPEAPPPPPPPPPAAAACPRARGGGAPPAGAEAVAAAASVERARQEPGSKPGAEPRELRRRVTSERASDTARLNVNDDVRYRLFPFPRRRPALQHMPLSSPSPRTYDDPS